VVKTSALALVLIVAVTATALAQDRLPPIPPGKYTPEQKKVVDEYKALRKENGPGGDRTSS
jgi:hypothetical protein